MSKGATQLDKGHVPADAEECRNQFAALAGGKQPVGVIGRDEETALRTVQRLGQRRKAFLEVKIVHHASEIEVAVGIKPLDESFSLVVQVAFNLEFGFLLHAVGKLLAVLQSTTELELNGILGKVGNVGDHPCQGESVPGTFCFVVLSIVKSRVGVEGAATYGIEGDVLSGKFGGGSKHNGGANLFRETNGLFEHLHAAEASTNNRE